MTLEQHYKTSQLAERLNIHPETIRRAVANGALKATRIGRDLIFSETDIAQWLNQGRVDNHRVIQLARRTG